MNFKESEIYKEIISSEKTLPIPYYINTGIIINEINVKFIIEIEIKKIKEKINIIGDKFKFKNYEDIINDLYNSKMNQYYLLIEYAYINKDNIDMAIKTIEESDNFYEWIF